MSWPACDCALRVMQLMLHCLSAQTPTRAAAAAPSGQSLATWRIKYTDINCMQLAALSTVVSVNCCDGAWAIVAHLWAATAAAARAAEHYHQCIAQGTEHLQLQKRDSIRRAGQIPSNLTDSGTAQIAQSVLQHELCLQYYDKPFTGMLLGLNTALRPLVSRFRPDVVSHSS